MVPYPFSPIHSAKLTSSFAQACLKSCRQFVVKLMSVKAAIIAEFQEKVGDQKHLVELAVNEAEALAWQTGFPQLVFPVLAEENARAVSSWQDRQKRLRSPWRDLARVR